MNAQEKMIKARTGLVLTSPFFASIALTLRLKEDPECDTAYTDTVVLGYNPNYIDKLIPAETKAVICHLALHVAMQHCFRRQERDQRLWDMACDYAINPLMPSDAYLLPAGALLDMRYAGMEAEAIYELLLNQNPPPNPSMGEVRDYIPQADEPGYENSIQHHQQEQKIQTAQALATHQGTLSQMLLRKLKESLQPHLPWREILSRFLSENARDDYNWKRPNQRYLHAGMYLPENRNPTLGNIAVLIDTSGSISQKQLDTFTAELASILSAYPTTEIEVIYVDSKVAHTESLNAYNLEIHAKGGGGTDFRPGFTYIDDQCLQPSCVLYFTDGLCHQFPLEPDYPVLWVISNGYSFTPPFGEVIHMSQ